MYMYYICWKKNPEKDNHKETLLLYLSTSSIQPLCRYTGFRMWDNLYWIMNKWFFIRLFFRSFVCRFVRSFVCLFVCLFVCFISHSRIFRSHGDIKYASSEIPALLWRRNFSAHALTLVGTKLTPYIGITL